MISTDNICMSCMKEIGTAKQCPYCGYHVDSAQLPPYLPVRTLLANRYLIGKLLDYNGEGATYIGWDISQRKPVSIREFFPVSIAMRTTADPVIKVMASKEQIYRESCQSFSEMWNKLMNLRGLSALINVTAVFGAFGTAYAVYDYVEGVTLREYLLSSKTGYLSWDRAKPLLMPVLTTLGSLHSSGIIHRGISPSTLIVGNDGKIRITGFSIWQARTAKSDLDAQLFPGYAAVEQYGFNAPQGAWTDIYSFGAVLYRTLIGSDPIDAAERAANDRLMVPGKFAELLPPYVINALINSLQVMPEDRTASAETLKAELSAAGEAPQTVINSAPRAPERTAAAPSVQQQSTSEPKAGGFKTGLIAALATILAGAIIFGAVYLFAGPKLGLRTPRAENTTSASDNGTGKIAVPDFSEKNYLDVTSNPVFKNNFKFDIQYVFDDKISKNYIVRQSIAPTTEVEKLTTITLFVSKGKEQIELPADLVGANIVDAEKRLTELGFKVTIKEVSDVTGYLDNTVLEIAPVPGQTYDKGTEVTVKVFKAPETTIPVTQENPNPWGGDISEFPLEEPDLSQYYEDIAGEDTNEDEGNNDYGEDEELWN